MFIKRTLGVAITVATVSVGAKAVVDLDAGVPVVPVFARETLSIANTTTGAVDVDHCFRPHATPRTR